ncbi:patatin [Marinithermofilum abyssi]|uniref:Patatin n=1 Tax=Marinithermofilum abyssi TaxID=1571185 RepID=A0A8J2VL45_9BACL|nr:patatin-like phospholipase family protein [Marinithermofilum abyssi]GGE27626.1 patatin [Marinithermofilum abyssi]
MVTVGVALGGGGVAGCAHLGVLRALEEARISIHSIAGTSAGAIFAALYACGCTPVQMIQQLPQITRGTLDYDYSTLLRKLVRRGVKVQGLVKGRKLHQLVKGLIGDTLMSDVKIPLAIMAADLKQARPVIFASRPLIEPAPDADIVTDIRVADAVVASCSIPLIFKPFIHGDRVLVDGGLLENCPVNAVHALGADKVIAVDMTRADPVQTPFDSMLGVVKRAVSIVLAAQVKQLTGRANVVLRPEVHPENFLDFSKAVTCMEVGYSYTHKRIDEIRRSLQPDP